MSHSGDLYKLSGGMPTEPTFDIVLRGYKKDQVDSFIHNLEAELAALSAERDEAYAQVHALAAQVRQLQAELTDLPRRGANSDLPAQHPPAAGHEAPSKSAHA